MANYSFRKERAQLRKVLPKWMEGPEKLLPANIYCYRKLRKKEVR